jgi:TetR/AcrR family transcriptional regulator, transcriptional repressor for nem operon
MDRSVQHAMDRDAFKRQHYHYFSDRDDLMRTVARAASDEVVGGQTDLLAHTDTLAGLRAWTTALVSLQEAPDARGGCPIGSLAGQLAERDEGARLELVDGFDRWEAAIRDGLEKMAVRRDPAQLRSALDGALDAILAARAVPER